jgi:DNA repair exonuclease SbcCD nuclease subunit
MKIAILGDTHFGARNDNLIFHKHFDDFYSQTFFPYLEEHGITDILQLGDIFDRRKYINFQTLSQSRKYFFDPLREKGMTMHVLVGNHDTFFKNTNEINSPSLLLNEYSNITIVNEPTTVNYDGVEFLMVPWISNENKPRVVKAIKDTTASVVAGHFEIIGFEMQKGVMCDEGIEPDELRGPELVISGHFHHKSINGNIQYLGTPYEMTWADHNDPKGFHVYDTATRELTFVRNPECMFLKIHYDDMSKTVDEVLLEDFKPYNGKLVKVIVRNKTNPTWFDMYIDKLEKSGVSDVQVVDDHLNLNLEDDSDIVNEAEDTMNILSSYIDTLKLENVDRNRLDKLMRTLYADALSVSNDQ